MGVSVENNNIADATKSLQEQHAQTTSESRRTKYTETGGTRHSQTLLNTTKNPINHIILD